MAQIHKLLESSSASRLALSRLAWTQINEIYDGEWVELVDYSWGWNESHPRWARIRHSATQRDELMRQISKDSEIPGSLILLIGGARAAVDLGLVANL
jgi:hypothetical protein